MLIYYFSLNYMSIPANMPITLPLFESVILHTPDYFVLPGKKQNQFKLVRGLTPSGRNITTRQGHKAIKIKKNERNELYLEERDFNNPRIEYGMFSPKDQKILKKYFAHRSASPPPLPPPPPPPPKKAYIAPPSDGSVSTISHKSFKTPEEEKADQKKERETMASEDSRTIKKERDTMASEDSRTIKRERNAAWSTIKKGLPPIISKREETLNIYKIPKLKSIMYEYKINFTKMKKDDMIKAILSHEKIPEGVKWDPRADWLYKDLEWAHSLLDPSSFGDDYLGNLIHSLNFKKNELLSKPKHSYRLKDEINALSLKLKKAERIVKQDFEEMYNKFMSTFKQK